MNSAQGAGIHSVYYSRHRALASEGRQDTSASRGTTQSGVAGPDCVLPFP